MANLSYPSLETTTVIIKLQGLMLKLLYSSIYSIIGSCEATGYWLSLVVCVANNRVCVIYPRLLDDEPR
jgi:hypothetical protein